MLSGINSEVADLKLHLCSLNEALENAERKVDVINEMRRDIEATNEKLKRSENIY